MEVDESGLLFIPFDKYVGEVELNGYISTDVMYMGQGHIDKHVYLYKHMDSRRYINIDEDGNFYKYNCSTDRYTIIDKETALNIFMS